MAIKRVWHGWTTQENADKYQNLLYIEVFPGIEAKKIPGYQSIEVFRRDLGEEVEFVTIMIFDSLHRMLLIFRERIIHTVMFRMKHKRY